MVCDNPLLCAGHVDCTEPWLCSAHGAAWYQFCPRHRSGPQPLAPSHVQKPVHERQYVAEARTVRGPDHCTCVHPVRTSCSPCFCISSRRPHSYCSGNSLHQAVLQGSKLHTTTKLLYVWHICQKAQLKSIVQAKPQPAFCSWVLSTTYMTETVQYRAYTHGSSATPVARHALGKCVALQACVLPFNLEVNKATAALPGNQCVQKLQHANQAALWEGSEC